jgi:flavin reductase (DIM6/NTAB) family NADH-FMN oxidoreductase RutF
MTIHSDHPFRDPSPDPVRRFRGRLGGAVSLWTSGEGADRAGLPVTSVLLAGGEPARLIALLDPDSDLWATLEETGTVVAQLLPWGRRGLAEAFGGLGPAPGGPFAQAEFVPTRWGPRLADADTWVGAALESSRPVGWSLLVTCTVEHVEVGDDDDVVLHRRGRYSRPRPDARAP